MPHPPSLDDIAAGDTGSTEARAIILAEMESFTSESTRAVYAALRSWLWKAVNSGRRDAELQQWYDVMRRAAAFFSIDYPEIAERITVLYELLYESIAVGQALPPAEIAERTHVVRGLNALLRAPDETLDREALRAAMNVPDTNLPHLLRVMVDCRLIEAVDAGGRSYALSRTGRIHSGSAADTAQ